MIPPELRCDHGLYACGCDTDPSELARNRGALPLDEALAEMKRSIEHARKLYFELCNENKRLREGIRKTVEGLDRADAYDTPLYERLTALLDSTRIPVTESEGDG